MASRADKSAAVAESANELVKLYPYQKAWILDESRFKLSIKARQIGYTFGTTLRHVRRRLANPGLTVWISASQRQSREAIGYCKTHLSAMREAFDYEQVEFPDTDETAEMVTLHHNKARIMGMPANPKTVRGLSGDVVLDEFAFHQFVREIWKASMAIMSRGHSLEVISTPNAQQGKYWELAKSAGVNPIGGDERMQWKAGIWSVHWCDIFQAVKQGCPIDPVAMKSAADDDDTWLQEYCCVFLADAENFIPMELIIANESVDATLQAPANFVPRGDLYLGGDIGRKKDRSVFTIGEKLGDVKWVRHIERMDRQSFAAQEAFLNLWIPRCRRASLDSTGLGMQLAENMIAKHGSKVEAVDFNIANKEKMATGGKSEFEERRMRIPEAAFLRSSINAVKRYTSPTGHFRFDAERTEAGHADEFWSLALMNAAASGPNISTEHFATPSEMAFSQAAGF
jgi:phage FluMu gp28-like protein